jgi:LEA14-like dessication related protein
MNHPHPLRLLLLLLSHVCLLATGCTTELKRPTASVREMTVGDVTPQGFIMNFEVDVENPNPVALPVADVDYQLRLVGRDFLDGEANPDASIPANGSMPVTLPVHVTFENLLAISDGIRKSGGDVPYELEAGLEFGGGMPLLSEPVRVPVRFTGTLPMRQLLKDPTVLLRSSTARELAQQVLGGLFGR